jgi:hypothetical protein
MCKMKLSVALILSLAAGAASSDKKEDASELDGAWKLTGAKRLHGTGKPDDITDSLKEASVVVEHGRVTLKCPLAKKTYDFPLKFGKAGSKKVDVVNVHQSLPIKCLYLVENATLSVSFNVIVARPGGVPYASIDCPRPTNMDRCDGDWTLFTLTFKRVMTK